MVTSWKSRFDGGSLGGLSGRALLGRASTHIVVDNVLAITMRNRLIDRGINSLAIAVRITREPAVKDFDVVAAGIDVVRVEPRAALIPRQFGISAPGAAWRYDDASAEFGRARRPIAKSLARSAIADVQRKQKVSKKSAHGQRK